jgi:hypothetical protein
MALNFKKIWEGLKIVKKSSQSLPSTDATVGDLEVLSDGKLYYRNDSVNSSPIVTESHSATLTNKTLTDVVLNNSTAGVTGTSLETNLSSSAQANKLATAAATKSYADTVSSAAESAANSYTDTEVGTKVSKAGDTMTGTLIINPASGNAIEAGDLIIGEPDGSDTTSIKTKSTTGTTASDNIYMTSGSTDNAISGSVSLYSGESSSNSSGSINVSSGTINSSTTGNSSGTVLVQSGNSVNLGSSGSVFVRTGTTNSGASGVLNLRTGNSSSGNSGNILISTGNTPATRGKVILDASSIEVSLAKISDLANGTLSNDAVNKSQLDTKQDTLISTTNIKTINGSSILGSGDLVVSGGASITVKDEGSTLTTSLSSLNFVGSSVVATAVGNDVTVTISGGGGGIPSATSFTLANNVTSATNITGLLFNPASVMGFVIEYMIVRSSSTTRLCSIGRFRAVYNSNISAWLTSDDYAGDNSGIDFGVTSAGQVTYTSTNITGTSYTGTLKYISLITYAP